MKIETKAMHTPGPWTYEKESDGQGYKNLCVKSAEGICIANIIMQVDDSEKANARLIAAAPELLEACRLLVACNETTFQEGMRQAKAAVAKAEGKT